MSTNRYIRFVELSSGLNPRLPNSTVLSKYSKKIYTQHQLLILLLLKEYLSEDYRDTVELTEIMDSLRKRSISMKYRISRRFTSSVNGSGPPHLPGYWTDSWKCSMTGERGYPVPLSTHPDSPVRTPVIIILENRKNQKTIPENFDLGWHGSTNHYRSEDLPTPRPWYSSCWKNSSNNVTGPDRLSSMSWIKEYDSEEIHELIQDTLNSCSLIPVRNRKRKRISGYYRKRIARLFDNQKYHQRNKIETVFSVMKRKFGESLKARKYRSQIKEIKMKVILYNISRMISSLSFLILIEEFYKAYCYFLLKNANMWCAHQLKLIKIIIITCYFLYRFNIGVSNSK